jgi:hypothetical protein
MKSLSKVAKTEVLQRNIPEDWSVEDRTSCKENIHLGCEDDIVKMVQVEGANCINTWGPTGPKGRPNQPGWAWAGRSGPAGLAHSGGRFDPPFLAREDSSTLSCWRRRHSREGEPFAWEVVHKLEREEERDRSREGSLYSKEAPTSGGEGRHRRKRHHYQRCYA